ncbi:MAG: hypothetical protein Aurels2KO_22480 [Aureliella sp.]
MIAMNNEMQIVDHSSSLSGWDQFACSHSSGTVFNTSALIEAFRSTPRHDVLAIGAVDHSGAFLAQLVSVATTTMRGIARPFSTRAIMYGPPLCQDSPIGRAALAKLLDVVDERMHKVSLFSEIRLHDPACLGKQTAGEHGYQHSPFLNFLVDVRQPEEQLWNAIGKQTRGKIRRSHARGVEIERDESEAGVEAAYRMIQASFRFKAVPLVDCALFQEARRRMPQGGMQVRLAKHAGKTVAATIGLVHGDSYYAWYGGTTRPKGIDPFACIVWDEIQWCHRNGLTTYDFGGAGAPDQEYGPRIFKSRFHGECVNYGRLRKVYSGAKLAVAERGFRSLNLLLSKKR